MTSNFIEWSGEGKLIHEKFGLNQDVAWEAIFSLSEAVNHGSLIRLKLKMPGTAISSPHELPFENYLLEGVDEKTKLPVMFKELFLNKWQEVYYYSYSMDFSAGRYSAGDYENISKLEFFIPNLLIGYNNLSLGKELINSSEFKIRLNETDYQITFLGSPKFNTSGFTSIEAQTNFTTRLVVSSSAEKLNYPEVMELVNTIMSLISFAYGSTRPWILIKGYSDNENETAWEYIRDTVYFDNSNPVTVIPVKFSSELSGFISQVFATFHNLKPEKNIIFNKLFDDLSKATLKVFFPGSFILLASALDSFSSAYLSGEIVPDILQEKLNVLFAGENIEFDKEWIIQFIKRLYEITIKPEYKEGDYLLFFQILSLVHKFVLKSLEYNGRYWDWSNISPVIRDKII